MLLDAVCYHPEGWGPVSRLRTFDLTPCFEEAILFSVPLASLIVLSLLRSWHLSRLGALKRTHRINTWLLWAKLVCIFLRFVRDTLTEGPRLSLGSFCPLPSSISASPLLTPNMYISSRRLSWKLLHFSFSHCSPTSTTLAPGDPPPSH
jgi:ATP-binding cassette, subfamily C (CFTR/MRP), member 1